MIFYVKYLRIQKEFVERKSNNQKKVVECYDEFLAKNGMLDKNGQYISEEGEKLRLEVLRKLYKKN